MGSLRARGGGAAAPRRGGRGRGLGGGGPQRPAGGPVPGGARAVVVAPAPGDGPGCWTGAPSAVLVDGVFWLAYRVRRARARGTGVVLARSDDGERFSTVLELPKERFAAESLERPALVVTPEGRWRLYISCATPGSK